MEPIYNIDFNRLIKWLVPPLLRNTITLNWLKALISPISWLYNNLLLYKSDVDYRIAITPQVCYLEKVLNDTFDNLSRRIVILDNPDKGIILIYMDESGLPLMTHLEGSGHDSETPIIHDDSSFSGISDFIVSVPVQLAITQAQEYRMKSILNTNKLVGKQYKIMYQ
jgi:hypothetical protein